MTNSVLSPDQLETLRLQFEKDGYLILRQFAPMPLVEGMKQAAINDLANRREPLEYEADVQYPGSPESRNSEGGKTIRRLRQALSRDPVFRQWVCWPPLVKLLQTLLGTPVFCPLAHHNCVMTKNPRFSSDTGWHRDLRFWRFVQPELISVWTALDREHLQNGCLHVLPGSHRMQFTEDQLDERLFLDPDLSRNQALLKTSVTAELQAGDVLLFHAQTFHQATRNYTDKTKYSPVFTFHGPKNSPVPGSRSAEYPELVLPVQD